jgi:hypothetical protein
MTTEHTTHIRRHSPLLAEVLATLDEHLDGVTNADEAADLIRAALRRHAARSPCAPEVLP